MVTTVGTETHPADLLRNLLMLEHDAIAAYDSSLDKLDTAEYRARIAQFRDDHHNHIRELRLLAERIGVPTPGEGDLKQMLTTGKVALARLAGDKAILGAMRSNEEDTVTAYARALDNEITAADWRPVFEQGLADEKRHRAWMERIAA